MRSLASACTALVLVALAACASNPPPQNPNDKPGGATNMQPGSGGTYGDVVRSQDGAGHGAGDTAQPTGVTPQEPTMPEPHNPTPPHQP